MLDITTIKKIFKLLEIEGFTVTKWSDVYYTFSCAIFEHPQDLKDFHSYSDLFYDVGYPLLLQRVIEAINRKTNTLGCSIVVNEKYVNPAWWNKKDHGGDYFYYTGEFTEKMKSIEPDLVIMSIDEAKEKAITYIMDHIKEKV